MHLSRRCRRLALFPTSLFLLSFLLPAHGIGSHRYIPGCIMLREWFHRFLEFSTQDVQHTLWYLVAWSWLANLLLMAGVVSLYRGKGLASIVLGIGGALLTIAPPFALGTEMFAAPCFLAWQGSMIVLVIAGVRSVSIRDGEDARPDRQRGGRGARLSITSLEPALPPPRRSGWPRAARQTLRDTRRPSTQTCRLPSALLPNRRPDRSHLPRS